MPTTSEYLLLFRGTQWYKGLSPAEIQKVMSRWRAWYNALQTQGKMKGGLPLMSEGKIISGARGRFVTDGPFTESKEAIGGYFLICVDSLEEAIDIQARGFPGAHAASALSRLVSSTSQPPRRISGPSAPS